MSHYIFVLNCGSSSLKFSVINPENGEEPLKGLAERLGVGGVGNITIKTAAGGKTEQQLDPGTHQEALHVIVAALKKEGLMDKIKAVGHRIVHGGEYFAESVLIDDDVREKIIDCIRLAPLHEAMFYECNPLPVKWALYRLGKIGAGIRLPLIPLAADVQPRVEAALRHAQLL